MSAKSAPVREPPIELKSIKPYVLRGNQLRGADPVITYYCFFWAIKQILANGLHTQSPECTVWTTDLMDELERRKAVLEGNELLTDDMAAQAYVENFALKIFNNGAQVVDANKATSQTSDTLLAGATLLEVCRVFGELDAETIQKIKYGKFHAARIWKEIQAGRDPNPPKPTTPDHAATPLPGPAPLHTEPPPDIYGTHTEPPPDIYGTASTSAPSRPPAPSIEEVPDESTTTTSSHSHSLHSPLTLPSPPRSPTTTHQHHHYPQSPPEIPTVHEPSAPSLFPTTMGPANAIFPDISPYNPPAPPQTPQVLPYAPQAPQAPQQTSPYAPQAPHQALPYAPQVPQALNAYHQAPTPTPPPQPMKKIRKEVSPEDMTKAQKHARWAISALDYEDVETAIAQFRLGLQLLGAE